MVMEVLNRWACIAVMGALLDDALMPIAKQLHLIHHNVGLVSIGSIIYVCMYMYVFVFVNEYVYAYAYVYVYVYVF